MGRKKAQKIESGTQELRKKNDQETRKAME